MDTDPDYDQWDVLVDTDPLQLRDLARRQNTALTELVAAVNAHKKYWPRVDWGSEQCERAVFAALDKAKKALDA